MENRRYINSYASTAAIINLQNQIDDINASGPGAGNAAPWAQVNNTDLIPDSKISETFAKAADLTAKADLVDGKVPVEQLPATTVGIVVGEGDDDAFAGSRGVALETKVTDLEATVSDKLGVDDVAAWAKSEDPTLIPVNKLDDHTVKYSDFVYTPSGEETPVTRKTIQLANYDSISGMNVAGNDAANLIMMSKWDKVDIGSSRYPVNLNGSEFTLNDEKHIATTDQIPDVSNFATKDEIPTDVVTHEELVNYPTKEEMDTAVTGVESKIPEVIEFKGLTELETGSSSASIQTAIGLGFEELVNAIASNKTILMDRNSAGDYWNCIRATGNFSGGNGGAHLMFMVGTVPTIYEVQYVNNEWALYVAEYEFAKKSDIPSVTDFATKEEVSTATANLVPNTRTIVGKALDSDITIDSSNLTDGDKLAFVYELNGLTNLQEGAGEDAIKAALGTEFEELLSIIRENKTVIVDRTTIGDYKTCIYATGNFSGGNGGINLMFFIGTKPTIFQIQYVSGIYALAVMTYEFAKKSDLEAYATTQNVSDSIAAEASARDKAIETATSDLVHNTLTVAGKSLTGNITLASSDLTDGTELAKTSDVTELDAKVFGDLDVSKFEENPELTCQVTKLDASYTGDLGLPDNINGQPYNAETNAVNPSINYLVLGYFDDGFVFHYDAWDALHSSAIFSTIISTVGLTNSTLDNRVPKTTKVAGHALNADVELTSTDLTDGAELAKKDEILDTVVDESRNETLRQSLTARTYLPFARNSDLNNQTEAQIFALFSNNVTDRGSLREYVQSNMAYISYNLDSLGEHQYYKSTILMASVPDDGDITVIAIAADIYNGDKLSKFTYTITLNGDASSVHIEKKALES